MIFLQIANISTSPKKIGVVKPKTRQKRRLKFNVKILLKYLSNTSGVKGKFVGITVSNLQT
jgi:hypothetical protein